MVRYLYSQRWEANTKGGRGKVRFPRVGKLLKTERFSRSESADRRMSDVRFPPRPRIKYFLHKLPQLDTFVVAFER